MDFTSEFLVTLTGLVLSLFFAYFPGVKVWFDKLDPVYKPLLNLGILLLVSVGAYLYKCRLEPVCLQANLEMAFLAFFGAVVANQTTYGVAVRQVKQKAKANLMRQWHG
jgi:hypothetical protein